MKGLKMLEITLLICILAEEIKRANVPKHVYGDSSGRSYTKKSGPGMKSPV